MSNIDYKNKYLKYKKKYIDFKKIQEINNLKGGYNNIDIDTTTTEFIEQNTINNRCLLLNSNYNPDVNQIKKYFELLDKLLVCSDFSINIEFLNIFYEYIFNSGKDNVNFINGDTNYTIDKIVAITENSEISLLKKKESNPENPNLPKTLILKKYSGITAKLINYLSLEIGHIIRKPQRSFIPSFQYNYYTMTTSQFNKINYNNISHEDLIKTNTKNNRFDIKNYDYDYLYLSCKNNNAINDFIINIILQKIISDNNFPDNFVKYHNLYISKDSTGTDCYYLIMETLNGTVKDLYDNEFRRRQSVII